MMGSTLKEAMNIFQKEVLTFKIRFGKACGFFKILNVLEKARSWAHRRFFPKTFYVGKLGNDHSNNGKTPDQAFLTFGKAVKETNKTWRYGIVICKDSGIYTEAIRLVKATSINAKDATFKLGKENANSPSNR